MVAICCGVNSCPYWQEGFCSQKVVKINEHGMCGQIYKGTTVRERAFEAVPNEFKEKIIMEELAWTE